MVNPEFKSFNFFVKSASRFSVMTDQGEKIDFSGSAMTAGYNFIDLPIQTISSLVYKTEANEKLTERLKEISGFSGVAYTNSGTEACDMALSRYGTPIISFEGSYHGRSYLTFRVSNGTGIDERNRIIHLKYPSSVVSAEEAVTQNRDILNEASRTMDITGSAVIIELIQSDGGEIVAPQEFLQSVAEMVKKHHMHLIIDEVYTGMGRSGEILLFKKFGLKPDMVCLGKGIAAGLPMGAVLYNGDWDLPTENGALGMLGGNDMACRAALSVLDSLDEKRLGFARKWGEKIKEELTGANNRHVGEVRGMGFMIGIDFVDKDGIPDTDYAYSFRDALAKNGLVCGLVGEHNNVLKITPPVLIDEETMQRAMNMLIKTMEELK